MRIILVSGDGAGAGKTVAANKFSTEVWSLASQIRAEVSKLYPAYDWWNRSQMYKNTTPVPEWSASATVRDVLFEYGQQKCDNDPEYWVRILANGVKQRALIYDAITNIAIDDVRKMCELHYLKSRFPCIHVHVENPLAVIEPTFDAPQLKEAADYVIRFHPAT